ncbi:sialic acid-binding Ig-like lectin 13 isoform X2 [Rhinatrema bivittatum]|uniref:sialic acid-binding Ig-like lectin 13 isoform X2 n=1 Tax=Rhinatrema bivittatum TaxID=194408 RepID=UPI00112D1CE2|nr:sialic acid-binding Ig-like lectin 13 isoform X2 [Rhinatrema bivittatum]
MQRAGLLLLSVLWEGFFCQRETGPPDYEVFANNVTVQEGLCVLIPCNFTFPEYKTLGNNPFGYWFREGARTGSDRPVATNNPYRFVSEATKGRFQLVGNILNRDCTFWIRDARMEDQRKYFLRIEGGFNFNYQLTTKPFVNVTSLSEQPQLSLPAVLAAGAPVNITCTAPGRCTGTAPIITWTGTLNAANSTASTSSVNQDGMVSHASRITFTPSIGDRGKNLTCVAYYPAVGTFTQTTLSLNVQGSVLKSENHTSVTIQEGSSVTFLCSMDSNSSSNITWQREYAILTGPETASNFTLVLNFSKIFANDSGEYSCVVSNELGTSHSSVHVTVQFGPRFGNREKPNCHSDSHQTTCSCAIQSNPPPVVSWLIDEELITGNFSNGTLQVSSAIHGLTGNSSLTLRDSEGSRSQIACLSSNRLGAAFVQLTRSSGGAATSPMPMILGGLCGAGIMALIILMVFLLVLGVKKMRKGNKSEGVDGMVDEGNLIYDTIQDDQQTRPSVAAAEKRTEAMSPASMSSSMGVPEEMNESLHYATIDFSKVQPRRKAAPESTEYSEVKLK